MKNYFKQHDTHTGINPDLHIRYDLIGNWKEANYMLRTLPVRVTAAVNLATRDFSRKYIRQVKKNIQNQGASLGWQPLSTNYIDFKTKWADSDPHQIYSFFGAMLSSMKAFKSGSTWVAGIPANTSNERMSLIRDGNTLTIDEYAAVLEKGTTNGNVPARPLWQPSYRQIGGNQVLQRTVANYIRLKFPHIRLKLS